MENDTYIGKWILFSSTVFALLGVASLLVTDFIFLPRAPGQEFKLYFSKEPILLASSSLFPALFAYFASSRWLRKGSRILNDWVSVAIFSWLSLVINPVIWLLVLSTFMLYGFIILGLLVVGGAILQLAWQITESVRHA